MKLDEANKLCEVMSVFKGPVMADVLCKEANEYFPEWQWSYNEELKTVVVRRAN